MSKLVFKRGSDNFGNVPNSFWQLSCRDIDGYEVDFKDLQGKYKAFLVVNVASFWGLTNKNYEQLVQLD